MSRVLGVSLEVFLGSHQCNELPYSQYLALIILLYKKGVRENIRNWRPISLSNSDIKILSKLLAERLKIVLPEIIDNEQSGCVKGRKIGHSIRLIEDIFKTLDDASLMLITDKMKAFDLVEWEWLFFVLNRYGFGEYFIGWIKIMYQGMRSAVMTNGYISTYFDLTRGIRQGDSLSALLYIIQSEPLAECIRQSKIIRGIDIVCDNQIYEMKGTQYVDDSTNMLKNSDQVQKCIEIISRFGRASGSRINKDKTIALVSKGFPKNDNNMNGIELQLGIDKMLGVPIGDKKCTESFWNNKISQIKKKIDFWKIRNLTLIGKVHIVKSVLIPLIYYGAAHVYISNEFIVYVQTMIWDFVWDWGTCLVSKEVIYLPRSLGGLGMPNFDLNIKAARIKMLIEIMKEESKWNFLARSYFKVLDSRFKIQYFAIFADDSSDLILQSEIPVFYKEVILAFHELCKKGKQCLSNEPLWYNSKINHRGKSLCYMNWVNSGICFLSDIIRNSNINDDIIFSKLQNRTNCFSELMTVKKVYQTI